MTAKEVDQAIIRTTDSASESDCEQNRQSAAKLKMKPLQLVHRILYQLNWARELKEKFKVIADAKRTKANSTSEFDEDQLPDNLLKKIDECKQRNLQKFEMQLAEFRKAFKPKHNTLKLTSDSRDSDKYRDIPWNDLV